MNRRNNRFIQLALLYFLLGGIIGLAQILAPAWFPGQPNRIHGHLMTIGFTGMIIFGIALHVLPRFSGRPLYSERMADGQFWCVNLGLWLLSLGWMTDQPAWLTAPGGLLEVVGFGLFGLNLAMTMIGYRPVAQEGMAGRIEVREPIK